VYHTFRQLMKEVLCATRIHLTHHAIRSQSVAGSVLTLESSLEKILDKESCHC
jgi:hypothetical protein